MVLKRFIRGSGGVYGVRSLDGRVDKKSLTVFYGETADAFGVTIDSLAYYFFISLIHRKLTRAGMAVESTVLLADTASLLNTSAIGKEDAVRASIDRRRNMLKRIIDTYHLPITVRLMSDLFQTPGYKKCRSKVETMTKDAGLMKKIEPYLLKTVLSSKRTEEQTKKYRYALDAVATGLLFDIKVGPPRERFYDEAGEILAPGRLASIYLKPAQPLGQNFSFFLTHPEIETYGVTPYKAGSNRLEDCRIILGTTSFEKAASLIRSSFESFHPHTVHPVGDVFRITEYARKLLGHDVPFPLTQGSVEELKEHTISALQAYIYDPLSLEGI